MQASFHLEKGRLWIDNYDQKKPFASFLPGVAGTFGIPMWAYYVNRGQLISSFGLESKDQPILDFSPANMAYRRTEIDGFRTLLKIDGHVVEPFSSDQANKRKMFVEMNAIGLTETIKDVNIEVKYFNVSEKAYPGLIRKVTLSNLGKKPLHVELIDGLATLWPFGTNQFMIKNMSNLAVAWFDVFNEERKMPLLKNRSTTEDTAEVEGVEAGHFYVSIDQNNDKLDVIYDPTLPFGYDTSLREPKRFINESLDKLICEEQVKVNQLMSAFSAKTIQLEDSYTFYTLFGKVNHLDELHELEESLTYQDFKDMDENARVLIESITKPMTIKTNYPVFDAYMKQSFLDNLLRGGYPLVFKGKETDIIYHIYSRIHGDMEREYNNFYVEPAYFSHGNGSYRDVNQNRRNDVYFVPEAQLFNIRQFMDLIQLDGHNPLTIQGSKLVIDPADVSGLLDLVSDHKDVVGKILKNPFTPGLLMTTIDHKRISLKTDKESFLKRVMKEAKQEIQSVYGTGYWSDHWMYNMDLIDSYLNVFPDHLESLLLSKDYRFYQSHVSVYPRSIKYVLTPKGEVRQLGPLYHDQEKIDVAHLKVNQTNFHKTKSGELIKVDLLTKLIHLATIKFSSLDPELIGIMMDSEKPGWNDAMNGLPAIFGSGVTETITLKRLITFLKTSLESLDEDEYQIPQRISHFFNDVIQSIPHGFDVLQDVREAFDHDTRFFMDAVLTKVAKKDLVRGLTKMLETIEKGLEKAKKIGDGLYPTYLTYHAETYEVQDKKHPELHYPTVRVTSWKVRMLPHYLEAPATYLKQCHDVHEAKAIYEMIRQTEMYDKKLKLYQTSASLDSETLEIGRARAFTKGWLEREACFMHMSYKYLIGVIKSGLYDEYYEDMKTAMPPFMDPEVYGRSPLENASFIATSNNPNPQNHGRSFVARLTGTTSEAITLLMLMTTGKKLFSYQNQVLKFHVKPILKKDFFDENDEVSITLFETVQLIIKNPEKHDTYHLQPAEYVLENDVDRVIINGLEVEGHLAEQIRKKHFTKITVTLKS
ncbi:MAG TPA: hypothetical protein PLJ98_04600 [Acholeplasmataceae bacterium]|nr:hypothetical protein [Acholeplasmataceae bacterium]